MLLCKGNMSWTRNILQGCLVCLLLVVVGVSAASAQSTSTNYRVDEYFFGNGGELEACSASYCSKQSAGETTVGNTASTNYQSQAGFNTTQDPMLEVAVNGAINFGVLDPGDTKFGSADIQVRTYLASGYNMFIAGPPPMSGSSDLNAMAAPAASQVGLEQFGINLRNNSTPDIGVDPVQVPSTEFSFGIPSGDYNTADTYKYTDGDIIAFSNSSSGQTNYTLSAIANIAASTPAGLYTTALSVVVVSAF
jgi:hypothetical protein